MTALLPGQIGLGERELVSVVGAGGKTTLLGLLGSGLASAGARVILTTTTRMAADQISEPVCWSQEPVRVDEQLRAGVALFVLGGTIPGKVTGLLPVAVDHLFAETSADFVIVEADGAGPWLIKAPAAHEPAIPADSTTVVVVVGAGALGRPLGEVVHRMEIAHALTGLGSRYLVTPECAADILTHANGGLKGIPEQARIVMAISNVTPDVAGAVAELTEILEHHPRVDRCITIPRF
jgi:probable selenium-dependent hydroxylase accessory protein YqeC